MSDIIQHLKSYQELLWINPQKRPFDEAIQIIESQFSDMPKMDDIIEADKRLRRFAPLFERLFPETQKTNGVIESELSDVEKFQNGIITFIGGRVLGNWYMKKDSHLDIAGSIKARGGVYEVITFAERLALKDGLIVETDSYEVLADENAKTLFSKYTLIVGSTGNLGLSIGIVGKALGFQVSVHMSHDAKPWKIQMLRDKGANVILHKADYSVAVTEGRITASQDPMCYFIDDENSRILFTGYAVAALRLKSQLDAQGILVDDEHPLFVYLPCGVGGAPGGISYGLKLIYKDAVKIFFAEPTHSPCMLLGLSTEKHEAISVNDIGIDNITDADGLAVGRPSGFVGQVISPLIDGVYTVEDEKLYWMLYMLSISEGSKLEPSALAGFIGPVWLFYKTQGFEYLRENGLLEKMQNATHISWATGGGLVPEEVMATFIERGKNAKVEF